MIFHKIEKNKKITQIRVLTLIVVQIQQFKYQTVCIDTLSNRVSNTLTWTCSLTATVDKLESILNFLFVLGLRMFVGS